MKKSSSTYGILVLAIAMLLMGTSSLVAQVLNKPTAADNPNLAGNSAWTAACASGSFNEYFVNFTWSPPLVDSNNEFILELSGFLWKLWFSKGIGPSSGQKHRF